MRRTLPPSLPLSLSFQLFSQTISSSALSVPLSLLFVPAYCVRVGEGKKWVAAVAEKNRSRCVRKETFFFHSGTDILCEQTD